MVRARNEAKRLLKANNSRKIQGDPLSRAAAAKTSRRSKSSAIPEAESVKLHGDPVRVRLSGKPKR